MLNSKLLISGTTILAAAVLIIGGTFAFFSDTETSTDNVLAAGSIDLKVDNTCYYNGNACVNGFWDGEEREGNECSCNWELKDLDTEKFFSLEDLKPGDWEEDTISLHVDDNDSWLCADVTLTSDNENTRLEPEIVDGDITDDPNGGELADRLNFIWWADDGDNVLEDDEETLPAGPMGVLGVGGSATVALADSNENIWDEANDPVEGDTTRYIGKGFCFGDITPDPVLAGDQNSPTIDPGFDCDGEQEDNKTQTDSFTADITFRAIQSRHNPDFQCEALEVSIAPTVTLTPTVTPTPGATLTPTPTPILSPTPTPIPSLVINEVSSDGNPNLEWVEIYNPTASAVDVSGWKIEDGNSDDTFPAVSPIPSGGYGVVIGNASTVVVPGSAITIILGDANIGSGLNDSGDLVLLRTPTSVIVDAMNYGNVVTVFPTPPAAPDSGESVARIPNGVDTNTSLDWQLDTSPTIGVAN